MSLLDRVGNALKAGGKSAADSILGPGDTAAVGPAMLPSGLTGSGSGSGLPSWALPAAGAALVLFLLTKK